MPDFQVNVPHGLGQARALEKLKAFMQKVAEHYRDQVSQVEGNWVENVLTFGMTTFGFTITGKLTVEESSAKIEGQLPFAAAIFKGKIEKAIADELNKELA